MHHTSLVQLRQRVPEPRGTAPAGSGRAFLGPLGGSAPPVRSLYLHIPFCFHKCHYCDFYSVVDRLDRQEAFVDRLTRELAAQAPLAQGAPLRTIFAGGGTPSLLRPDLWRRLLADLARLFDLSALEEFTVECNPETVTPELAETLARGGVTRVSMGAQSFERRHLKTLERWHDPENVARALAITRDAGIRRDSIDLIFGVPGQTVEEWRRDLGTALALGTEHLSAYSLTYEPRTKMTARLKKGEFAPVEEDDEVAMHEAALQTCRAAGLDRYEVSNYARRRPGARGDEQMAEGGGGGEEETAGAVCRHNMAYWRQEGWLACGPSAAGYVPASEDWSAGGHRWKNTTRLDEYLAADDAGFCPVVEHEPPDARRAISERLMTGLRLAEGVDAGAILAACGRLDAGLPGRMERIARQFRAAGHLDAREDRWTLTDRGFLFADGIAGAFMAEL